MTKPCECSAVGWCPLNRFHVTARERELCQTDEGYRRSFRSGKAPQHAREKILHPKRFPIGDWLAAGIKLVTFGRLKQKSGCGCRARQEKLNSLGERLREWLAERLKTVRRSAR